MKLLYLVIIMVVCLIFALKWMKNFDKLRRRLNISYQNLNLTEAALLQNRSQKIQPAFDKSIEKRDTLYMKIKINQTFTNNREYVAAYKEYRKFYHLQYLCFGIFFVFIFIIGIVLDFTTGSQFNIYEEFEKILNLF